MKTKIIIIAYLFTCFACDELQEEISLDINDKNLPDIAVDGMITDQQKAHVVRISIIPSFTSQSEPEPVSGATVTISSETDLFPLEETSPGIYRTSPDVKGEAGKSYTLTILCNGKEYSATSRITPPVNVDTLYTRPGSESGKYYILFSSYEPSLPGTNAIFKIYKNGQVNDTIRNWPVINDFINQGFVLRNFPIAEYEAMPGDSIKLESYSVEKNFIDFILAAYQIIQVPSPYLSSPPANLKTNFSKGAVGYFLAAAVRSNHCRIK